MIFNEPAEVLINKREPFNKNSVWICPNDDGFEVKLFNKGWEPIFSTQDKGLSEKSKEQIDNLVKLLTNTLNSKLTKEYGRHKSSLIQLRDKERELENKVNELENKLDKLTKRYATLLVNKH